jgi:hypothetical protein
MNFIFKLGATVSIAATITQFHAGDVQAAPPDKHNAANPWQIADIVGRDLDVRFLGPFGHVGLSDGRTMVLEALNENPVIQLNTLTAFKNRSRYWGAIYYPDWSALSALVMSTNAVDPTQYAVYLAPMAAYQQAMLAKQIGARYTWSPVAVPAGLPACKGCPPRLGVYRCDSFVKDALRHAGVPGMTFEMLSTPGSLWRSNRFPLRPEVMP